MPSDHIDCPFCSKSVSRINFGAHLLSKEHLQRFYDENKSIFQSAYNKVVERKEDPEKLLCLKAGSEQVRLCLGCKRCYAYVAMRKEGKTHFEDHPDCCERVRAALTTLCGPKEVVMTDPDALQKENDSLKREIERLKKQPVITTPATIVMTEDYVPKEKYDEEVSLREEAEEDSDKMRGYASAWRGLWKEFLGKDFPEKTNFESEIEFVKEFLEAKKAAPPPPPAPPPAPAPKNESKIAAYVAAHISKDLETQTLNGKGMTNAEMAEANKRIAEYEASKRPAPPPAFKPPPLNPQILTSTLRLGKQLDRQRVPPQTT